MSNSLYICCGKRKIKQQKKNPLKKFVIVLSRSYHIYTALTKYHILCTILLSKHAIVNHFVRRRYNSFLPPPPPTLIPLYESYIDSQV